MARPAIQPTGREVHFAPDDVIVSKTDLAGRITYANDVFLAIAGYAEEDVLGEAHNLIRHPDMPRTVFAFLWEALKAGEEVFAYVKNMTKTGDHYWVLAHVTPSRDAAGAVTGYHSNRRVPDRGAVERVSALYAEIRRAEQAAPGPREALQAGRALLDARLAAAGLSFNAFVFSLSDLHQAA